MLLHYHLLFRVEVDFQKIFPHFRSVLPLGLTSGVEGHGMDVLRQQSQTFLVPGTGFMEDNFPQNEGWGVGWGWCS